MCTVIWLNTGMTKKLEELFNLPQSDDDETSEVELVEDKLPPTLDTMSNLEKIDSALPAIKGLEASDKEMDDIAEMAISSYKDLIDLGMNVEARLATEILGAASSFLGHAITARTAKVNKKLKMIDLQLKKLKLDQERGEGLPEAEGEMIDRNEIVAQYLEAQKANQAKKE